MIEIKTDNPVLENWILTTLFSLLKEPDPVQEEVLISDVEETLGRTFRRLTLADAKQIKKALAKGLKQAELAKKHNVSYATISNIATGRTWKKA